MSRDNDLPFERGTTYCQGDTTAIADLDGEMEGQLFVDKDPTTGLRQTLIVLKNSSGGSLGGGRGCKPAAGYLGRRTDGYVASTAGFGFLIDPYYATLGVTIADGDLFYAIYDGFVTDAKLGATTSTDAGACCFDNAGYLIPQSTNVGHVLGRFAEAVASTGQGNERVDAQIGGPYGWGADLN